MKSDEIAPAVRELISGHLRSMDHVEALLHLADAPGQAHETEAIAARHRWARGTAARVLGDLAASGLATPEGGGYRLSTRAADAATLGSLSDLYHKHPVSLVRAIYSVPFPVKPLTRPATPGA